MTGYYEPLLYGSRVRQPPYVHPIYGIPDNLLTIDLGELYPDLKGRRLRGKLDGRRVVPYDKRGAIQEKEAEMARWAIAWVSDPVDAFFLHVQGSGRIVLPDGSFMRVGFADQNGWRYHSIGQWLITHEHLSAHELSMQRIRSWAKANPSKVKAALAQNPSYIFLKNAKATPNSAPSVPPVCRLLLKPPSPLIKILETRYTFHCFHLSRAACTGVYPTGDCSGHWRCHPRSSSL